MARTRYKDFVRTGPGTLAGRYMRRFWQPVYHSHDLAPGRAAPLRIMSEEFTLYRGQSGTPYLLDFRCAHRGTQLSVGWVEGDCIRCFYHGWKYDGSGQCVEQPAEPKPFVEKIRIRSYPVREYIGLIFAYLDEGEPPEFPRFPDFEDFEGILEWDSYTRACNYFANLENSIDTSHVGFVHLGVPGSMDGLADPTVRYSAEESEWGIAWYSEQRSGKRSRSQFGMPNMFHAKVLPNVPDIVDHREFLVWWVPIDDENHIQFSVYAVRLPKEKAERYIEIREERLAKRTIPREEVAEAIFAGKLRLQDIDPQTTDIVRLQDDLAQLGQGHIPNGDHDHLGRADAGVIMIRKLWQRELKAVAEGRPVKQWHYVPEHLERVR